MTTHREIATALSASAFDSGPEAVADDAAAMSTQDLASAVDELLTEFGEVVEDAADKIIGMWAASRAIYTATRVERAKAVADYFEPFARLIVALELCAPVDTHIPLEVADRLGHLLPEGVNFPIGIPAPAVTTRETDFAAGVRLGISRARIFERKSITGQLRRRRKK